MTEETEKRGRGRPCEYDPAMCDKAVDCGENGFSRAEIAAALGISRTTMATYEEQFPDFLDATQRAHDLSLSWWEAKGRTGLDAAVFQSNLWAKCMTGRFPDERYRERHELSGPKGGPIPTETQVTIDAGSLSDDQLRALASIAVHVGRRPGGEEGAS